MNRRRLYASWEWVASLLMQEAPVTFRVSKNALPSDAKIWAVEIPSDPAGTAILWIESAAFRDDDPIDLPLPIISMVESK